MHSKLSRRQLLVAAGRLGAFYAAFEVGRKGLGLLEQHRTWEAAAQSNDAFFDQNASRLESLELGGSFAPEQWGGGRRAQQEMLAGLRTAVHDLNLRKLRLGIRWSRVHREAGPPDLTPYRAVIDYCFANGVEVCLNPGPIKTFRWPEEHVPAGVLASLEQVPKSTTTLTPDMPLAQLSLAYLDSLLETMAREYSASDLSAVRMVQPENEPFYPLGEHRWTLSPGHIQMVAERLHAAFPEADVLLTTAGRLNLREVRDVLVRLQNANEALRGKLVSGFDFHYRTPERDSFPIIRHFDQITYARPGVEGTDNNIADSREVGYRIEVTEGQMEPYGHFHQPGNSAKELRYLLLRCFDHVLDPYQPALVRLWGVEELVKKMVRGELTNEHRGIIEIIQRVNDGDGAEIRRA